MVIWFLKMQKAKLCREAGRMAESARWCRAVVESAKPMGIAQGRVYNMAVEIYETLGIRRGAKIGNQVW